MAKAAATLYGLLFAGYLAAAQALPDTAAMKPDLFRQSAEVAAALIVIVALDLLRTCKAFDYPVLGRGPRLALMAVNVAGRLQVGSSSNCRPYTARSITSASRNSSASTPISARKRTSVEEQRRSAVARPTSALLPVTHNAPRRSRRWSRSGRRPTGPNRSALASGEAERFFKSDGGRCVPGHSQRACGHRGSRTGTRGKDLRTGAVGDMMPDMAKLLSFSHRTTRLSRVTGTAASRGAC